MARIVSVGEAMVELSAEAGEWHVGHGGDTLNTAVHLARSGHDVAYMTALGTDPFSAQLRAAWHSEGIDDRLILTHPTRPVGLYAIATDASGERSFTYWRDSSAARALFEIEAVTEAAMIAETADLLCFSLISLAILPPQGRTALLDLASRVRKRGGRVAFDGNYRARLWETPQAAVEARDAAIAVADIGLPTLEDEMLLGMAPDAHAVAAHWARLGCIETIVKLGAAGCLLPGGAICPVPNVLQPLDTSGAGDAFNAGYLAARMAGQSIAQAARRGHALAGWTVTRRGAIPERDHDAPYAAMEGSA